MSQRTVYMKGISLPYLMSSLWSLFKHTDKTLQFPLASWWKPPFIFSSVNSGATTALDLLGNISKTGSKIPGAFGAIPSACDGVILVKRGISSSWSRDGVSLVPVIFQVSGKSRFSTKHYLSRIFALEKNSGADLRGGCLGEVTPGGDDTPHPPRILTPSPWNNDILPIIRTFLTIKSHYLHPKFNEKIKKE